LRGCGLLRYARNDGKQGRREAPVSFSARATCASPIIAAMPAVPMMIAAHPARTVIGVDDPAVRIVGRVIGIVPAIEAAVMEMREAVTAKMMEAAKVPEAAAMPAASAAMPTTVESTAVEAAMTATVTTAAMAAANLDHAVIGGGCR